MAYDYAMQKFNLPKTKKKSILGLGAESSGNFSYYTGRKLYFSQDFGDLLIGENFSRFQKELSDFLKKEALRPDIILSDLHPDFLTTMLAQKLAKKYTAHHIKVQHHHAHILSAIADRKIRDSKFEIQNPFLGVACDGTGYSEDGTVWGGEIFIIAKQQETNPEKFKTNRVGHLEYQTLIGGERAIWEPARLIIAIVSKFQTTKAKKNKGLAYSLVKKYYSKNAFELLWNQMEQNFNCIKTSSTARVLDAASVLLGFSENERLSKHGPVELLEKNSTKPYQLKPRIGSYKIQNTNYEIQFINTTYLFKYLIKNLHKDKKRLGATAQQYIADGLLALQKECTRDTKYDIRDIYFSGGMANNKIISSALEKKGFYMSKKIPRGDAGISVGQIFYYLLTNPRD